MLKITVDIEGERAALELEGRLAGPWVQELRDCWQRAESDGRQISVVLKQVTFHRRRGKTTAWRRCVNGEPSWRLKGA